MTLPLRFCLATAVAFFTFSAHAQNPEKLITSSFLCDHIYYLASDSMKGRNTPGAGLDSAAAFIAREFKAERIMPVNGSYFQTFFICKKNLGETNLLTISKNGEQQDLKLKTGFVPFDICSGGKVDAPLVFAGYGITAPEYKYDDYAGLDVSGRVVLVLRNEPQKEDSNSVFNGAESTPYASLKSKMLNAARHGAIAMLVVNGPLNFTSMKPRGYPWPALSKVIPTDALPFGVCGDNDTAMPVLHVGEEAVNLLFGSVDSLRRVQSRIDSLLVPRSFNFTGVAISADISMKEERLATQNVVGMIPGADPSGELLVIGGHYDHVGYMKEHADSIKDYIFNGADDNASGTSGVMAVAKAMASMKKPPERTVLFILFAGEEKGLFGSRYYVTHPLLPLEKTVAMLNMDMISRNGADSLQLAGAPVNPDLTAIIKKENKKPKMILVPDSDFIGGSDHYPFYKKNIPFMFFFTGLHKDYHTVRDNPDKVDCNKAARIARLVYRTAVNIANSGDHYKLIEKDNESSMFD
jgi:hypothetical protein